jgi:nucleotide-binding universal stress UspA family protein
MLNLDRILFPTDFSETARHALPYAAYLAARHDAALTILHVQSPGGEEGADPDDELDICQETASRQFDVDLGDLEGSRIEREVRSGTSVDEVVVEEAEAHGTDLVVMGTARRHGLASLFPQSTAVQVVRRAPCPVVTLLSDAEVDPAPLRRILVPTDFSDPADQALGYARDLAARDGATIIPVHVIEELTVPLVYDVDVAELDTDDVRRRARSSLQEVSEAEHVRVVSGHPGRRIVEVAEEEEADLIVIATHGRTGLPRVLLGSVAETVIRQANCPVLTVRSDLHAEETAGSKETRA